VRVGKQNGGDRGGIKVWREPVALSPQPLTLKDATINQYTG